MTPTTCAAPEVVALPFGRSVAFGAVPQQHLPCSPDGRVAAAVYFRVTVPARHTLVASGQGPFMTSQTTPSFRLVDRCDAERCVDVGTPTSRSDIDAARVAGLVWFNPSSAPREVTVEVTGTTDAGLSLATHASLPINQCETAAALPLDVRFPVALNPYHAEQQRRCCSSFARDTFSAHYYSVTVPARRTLFVTADTYFNTYGLQILSSCEERAVLACQELVPGFMGVRWRNDSDAPRSVLVVTGLEARHSEPFEYRRELNLAATLRP